MALLNFDMSDGTVYLTVKDIADAVQHMTLVRGVSYYVR